MQITYWGPDTNPETKVHEYAQKEWAGLLKDVYLPRWRLFFKQLGSELTSKPTLQTNFLYYGCEMGRKTEFLHYFPKA